VSAAQLLIRRRDSSDLVVLATVAVAALIGWSIAGDRSKYAALPIAALAILYLLRRPVLLLVIPLAVLSIASPTYIKIVHFGLAELIVLAGVAIVAARGEFELEATGVWLAVLIACSFAGIAIATGHGMALHDAFAASRFTVVLAAFWIALALFRHDRDRTLVALSMIACGVAGVAVVQEVLPGHVLYLGGGAALDQVLTPQSGILRVRLPGDLVYTAEFFVAAYLLWGPRRQRRRAIAMGALLAVAILISLNRNWIMGLVIGITVVWLLGRTDARTTLRLVFVSVVAGVVLTAASGTGLADRVLSLGDTSSLQQGTLSDRHYENSYAGRALHVHPITGVGWAPYGAVVVRPGGVREQRGFIHNQYLGTWLRAGILGLVALLMVLFRSFTASLGVFRRTGDWLAAGTAAAVIGIASSSVVGIYIQEEPSAIALVTVAALSVVLRAADRSSVVRESVIASVPSRAGARPRRPS
jgi:O-antigen ligase